ncbi:DUF6624 domain-containing protein [Streptomyces sp. NPDC127037]|uniref:DUF6624 domain-containing protein n=1 Tax=Streptomyces sp. NPDC127037 TaxID=3347113 RepID=UPI00364F2005
MRPLTTLPAPSVQIDAVRRPDMVVGAMTGKVPTPTHPEIARDLIGRVESAAATWRAPACEREAVPEGVARAARNAIESDSQALRRIVARLQGWPGHTLVGEDGCQAALAIALNSDSAVQVTLLHLLAEAVRRGDATTAQWAHLHDRCLVRSGRPQTYGTQYRLYDGQLEMCPVADPEDLDQQRASVGLPPHRDQFVLLERRHVAAGELASVTRERSAA